MNRQIAASASARPLFPVAPPVDSLNIVGMIIPPRSAHAGGIDVVGHNVAVVRELFIADGALAFLGKNLPVKKLSHFRIRAYLPITARVMEIVNAADTHLALPLLSRDCLSATAGERTVKWAQLIATESHGFLQLGFGGN